MEEFETVTEEPDAPKTMDQDDKQCARSAPNSDDPWDP